MRTLLLPLLLLFHFAASAQDAVPDPMEHFLHGNGKMNVVVIVVALVLAGIALWMWRMDRKLKRMEDRLKK